MSAPSQRDRRDRPPLNRGGEIALAVIGTALLAVTLVALVGLGGACAVFGRGWVWPHGSDTITRVVGGLLSGHPGRGLTPAQQPLLAAPTAVYACIAACETALAALAVTAGVLYLRYHRPSDARAGMATRAEAAHVLGVAQLRSARAIIRPDLHRPR